MKLRSEESFMYNPNDAFRYLHLDLPSDIARLVGMGDLDGAVSLIDHRLDSPISDEMAMRLKAEKVRLERLPLDFTLTREQAIAAVREEWPDFTEAQFDALLADDRIDWRVIRGTAYYHRSFLASLRLYPKLAPGLKHPAEDQTYRDETLAAMRGKGTLTAYMTVRASIRANVDTAGKEVQAWLPVPARSPAQDWVEVMDASWDCVGSPEDAPQRTFSWKVKDRNSFYVIYRLFHRARYVDPLTLKADPIQPGFYLDEELPHLRFTPYLRALAAKLTKGMSDPIQKAKAIYDYVTTHMEYRYQPSYVLLDPIADQSARDLRGDCGMFAILFITLCRIAGIPAKWESGLAVKPTGAGPHDWAMFYVAPHGWLWADCSYGAGAHRNGEEARRLHYFGSLDPWRMVANSAFQAPLVPPVPGWRHDPYDNQTGEIMVDGRCLTGPDRESRIEVLQFELF